MPDWHGSRHRGKVGLGVRSRTPCSGRWRSCTRCLKRPMAGWAAWSASRARPPRSMSRARRMSPPARRSPARPARCGRRSTCGRTISAAAGVTPASRPRPWGDRVYPAAPAIELPPSEPQEILYINLAQKVGGSGPQGRDHPRFDGVTERSIEGRHRRHGLLGHRRSGLPCTPAQERAPDARRGDGDADRGRTRRVRARGRGLSAGSRSGRPPRRDRR